MQIQANIGQGLLLEQKFWHFSSGLTVFFKQMKKEATTKTKNKCSHLRAFSSVAVSAALKRTELATAWMLLTLVVVAWAPSLVKYPAGEVGIWRGVEPRSTPSMVTDNLLVDAVNTKVMYTQLDEIFEELSQIRCVLIVWIKQIEADKSQHCLS